MYHFLCLNKIVYRYIGMQRYCTFASEVYVGGEEEGKVLLRDWNHTTRRAMNEGNRCPPVSLARDQPISQLEIYVIFPRILLFQI